MTEVCCAIIIQNLKILAVQKGTQCSNPLKWEFPGGKIHSKETAEACIIREIKEELQIEIQILRQLDSISFDYGNNQILLIPFICLISNGEITLTEHIAMQWIDLKNWKSLDWSGADYQLIQKNKNELIKELI